MLESVPDASVGVTAPASAAKFAAGDGSVMVGGSACRVYVCEAICDGDHPAMHPITCKVTRPVDGSVTLPTMAMQVAALYVCEFPVHCAFASQVGTVPSSA